MQTKNIINDFLESVSKLSLEDQLMISNLIYKRVIEERRKEISDTIRESREEYYSGRSGRGSVEDFLKDAEK
ncbi:MAG TPA: hypothetical protein PLZ15_10690 [Melioribacteraceae bacterium]|nr:hypothetical protein [Melioribacteraceae bacterium]